MVSKGSLKSNKRRALVYVTFAMCGSLPLLHSAMLLMDKFIQTSQTLNASTL